MRTGGQCWHWPLSDQSLALSDQRLNEPLWMWVKWKRWRYYSPGWREYVQGKHFQMGPGSAKIAKKTWSVERRRSSGGGWTQRRQAGVYGRNQNQSKKTWYYLIYLKKNPSQYPGCKECVQQGVKQGKPNLKHMKYQGQLKTRRW